MKCEHCQAKEASFFYQETVNGKSRSVRLCAECAAKLQQGGKLFADSESTHIPSFAQPMEDLLGGLFGFSPAPAAKESKTACPDCGATWAQLLKSGKAVCPRCYETFGTELQPTLRQLHGNVTHTGRAPAGRRAKRERRERLDALRREMTEAITAENFERAAVLRDEIRALEQE